MPYRRQNTLLGRRNAHQNPLVVRGFCVIAAINSRKRMHNVEYETGFTIPGLPKWPAIAVQGKRVSRELAAEILIRTDTYLPDYTYGGNDKEFCHAITSLFGIPKSGDSENWVRHYNRVEHLRRRLRKISLEYLANAHISSAWIGGPHGWIDWSGNVFCNTFNIGKWPSVTSVAEDWAAIAEAFPELDLVCQLYEKEAGEDGENSPVVEFVVRGGQVVVQAPMAVLAPPADNIMSFAISLFRPGRERGITIEYLREEIERIYGAIPQYADMPDTHPDVHENEVVQTGDTPGAV